jgi:hypothetical protein
MAEQPAERQRRQQTVEGALEALAYGVAEWAFGSWARAVALAVVVLRAITESRSVEEARSRHEVKRRRRRRPSRASA